MKCLKEKCIHHDVCALYTFSGYASDECGFYESRPQGEWIDYQDDKYSYLANCSKCGYQMDTHEEHGYFNFCPNCGADMREGEAE